MTINLNYYSTVSAKDSSYIMAEPAAFAQFKANLIDACHVCQKLEKDETYTDAIKCLTKVKDALEFIAEISNEEDGEAYERVNLLLGQGLDDCTINTAFYLILHTSNEDIFAYLIQFLTSSFHCQHIPNLRKFSLLSLPFLLRLYYDELFFKKHHHKSTAEAVEPEKTSNYRVERLEEIFKSIYNLTQGEEKDHIGQGCFTNSDEYVTDFSGMKRSVYHQVSKTISSSSSSSNNSGSFDAIISSQNVTLKSARRYIENIDNVNRIEITNYIMKLVIANVSQFNKIASLYYILTCSWFLLCGNNHNYFPINQTSLDLLKVFSLPFLPDCERVGSIHLDEETMLMLLNGLLIITHQNNHVYENKAAADSTKNDNDSPVPGDEAAAIVTSEQNFFDNEELYGTDFVGNYDERRMKNTIIDLCKNCFELIEVKANMEMYIQVLIVVNAMRLRMNNL